MTDLEAGTRTRAQDVPPTVAATVNESFNTTLTGSDFGTQGQTGNCGVAFVAPTSGRVIIHYKAQCSNSGATWTALTPIIRRGDVVGEGGVEQDSNGGARALALGPALNQAGISHLYSDLTPGDLYNARLEHVCSGGTSSISRRHIIVAPTT